LDHIQSLDKSLKSICKELEAQNIQICTKVPNLQQKELDDLEAFSQTPKDQ
jgi:serine O-acetyltransferase